LIETDNDSLAYDIYLDKTNPPLHGSIQRRGPAAGLLRLGGAVQPVTGCNRQVVKGC
jgi:hypothetical protein